MPSIRFEWDEAKNRSNLAKHGLSFEQAIDAFRDPLNLPVLDRIENGEVRWQTYGMIGHGLIMVAHTSYDFEDEEIIRIISARRASKHERRRYEEQDG
jgi:uncharacterized DUF497 family protein